MRRSGCVATKRGRFYAVLDMGRDPKTGRRSRQWHSGPDRQGFATAREAERALRELLRKVDQGSHVDPSRLTLESYLVEDWLPSLEVRGLRAGTRAMYATMVNAYVVPRLGAVPIQRLTGKDLTDLYADLLRAGRRDGRGLSPKTTRNVHTMLSTALKEAERRRPPLITRNPATIATPPRLEQHERQPWTAEQVARFLQAAHDDRLYAAFVLAATTGMRRGEVLGLRDLDLGAARLSVVQTLVLVGHTPAFSKPKTKAGRRSVPLAAEGVAALKTHRKTQAADRLALGPDYTDQDLVFATEDGTALNPARMRDAFTRHAKAAELPKARIHDLRHSFATSALRAGVPAKIVQEILGHASVTITLDLYSHAIPSMQEDATTRVADLIFGTGPVR